MKRTVFKCGVAAFMVLVLLSGLMPGCAEAPAPSPSPTPTPPPAPPPPSPPAPPEVYKWNFQGMWGGSTQQRWFAAQVALADIIEDATDGKVEVTTHETLIQDAAVLDAVLDRTLDVGCQGMHFRAELSLFNFTSLPFVPHEKMPEILAKLRPLFQQLFEEEHDCILLAYNYFLPQFIFSNEPIMTFEDLQRAKLRILGVELVKLFQDAGANPVNVPFPEVYTSLQRGMIDGAQSSLPPLITQGWHESAKYIDSWPLGCLYIGVIVNKDAWNELGPELQQKLMARMEQFEKDQWDGVLYDQGALLKQAEELGCTSIDTPQAEKDKLLAYVGPVVDDWKTRVGPHADDVLAVVNEVLGTNY